MGAFLLNPTILSFVLSTGISLTTKLLANHAGKPASEMTEAEMLAAVAALQTKSPEQLIAEGAQG